MNTQTRRFYWRLCYVATILLSLLTFTPVITPLGTYRPMLLGLPYTLWTGLLLTIALVAMTYVAGRVYPVNPPSTDIES